MTLVLLHKKKLTIEVIEKKSDIYVTTSRKLDVYKKTVLVSFILLSIFEHLHHYHRNAYFPQL